MRWPTFDQVPDVVADLVDRFSAELSDLGTIYALRDLWGRIRFLIRNRPEPGSRLAKTLDEFSNQASDSLGPRAYLPDRMILYRDEVGELDEELHTVPYQEIRTDSPAIRLIDRQVTGSSWATVDDVSQGNEIQRLAFYSLKGGVGRSTTTAVTAWHLARLGKSVLVVDLDLEAPGLSSSILPKNRQPKYGIVDWFVEDAVGGGNRVLHDMTTRSPLADELPGEIWVVPSHGEEPGEFIAKLGRCYLDLVKDGRPETWEQRLFRLLREVEGRHRPDVVLLDTRSGLPDLASTAVTELASMVLLFGLGSSQTWSGYRLLFDYWVRLGAAYEIRERLKMVSALVPETNRDEYLSGFRQDAWDLFTQYLFDELPEGELEGFNFDLDDPESPHNPLEINWNRGFASLTKLDVLDEQMVSVSYSRFLEGLDRLLGIETEQ